MKDLSAIGPVVRVQTHVADGNVSFDAEGEDAQASIQTASGKAGLDDDGEETEQKVIVKKDVDMKFTIRYLILFSKAASLSPKVRIELTNDNPVKVMFEFGKGGKISFLLACSVEGDDGEADGQDAGDDDDM